MPALLPLIVMLASPEVTVALRHAASAGDLRPLAPVAESEQALFSPSFRGVRELLERYDCIAIESIRSTGDAENDALILDLDGSGITRNEARERRPIPARWYVALSADGTAVASIEDDASRDARRLIEAGSDEERAAIVEASEAALPVIARRIADEVRDGWVAEAGAAAELLLARAGTQGDAEAESYALATLAQLEYKSGRSETAVRLAEASRAAAARSGLCDATAHADYIAGIVDPDLTRGISLLRSAAAAPEALDDPRLAHWARYHEVRRRNNESFDMAASRATLDALEVSARRYGDRRAMAWARYGMAILTATLDDRPRAYEMSLRVAGLARVTMIDSLLEGTALSMVGRLTRNNEEAIAILRRAEAIVPPGAASVRTYLASAHSERLTRAGRFDEAAAVFDRALKSAGSPEARVNLLNALTAGVLLRTSQGHFPEAMQLARRGIDAHPDSLWVVWALRFLLGRIQMDCADYEGAIATLREAVSAIETRRALTTSSPLLRARHFATRANVYHVLIQALVHEHRFEEALITAERLRARSLEDAVAGVGVRLTEAQAAKERALEAALVARNRDLLAATPEREAKAREQLAAARAELDAFHTDMALRNGSDAAAPPANILEAVAGAPLPVVEYAVTADSIIAFVIRDGAVEVRTLAAPPKKIEADARELLQKLSRRSLDYANSARILYDELVAPIAGLLPAAGAVTIVPDQFLWQVPFNVLLTPKRRHFGDSHAISYAPSLTMLHGAARRTRAAREGTLLAVGDPLMSTEPRPVSTHRNVTLGALPDAQREVRALQDLYRPEPGMILTGAAARESVFKKVAGRYRILHLATHGLVDDASPLYSALLLGTLHDDEDDGLLEMREIRRLRLNADLVVLSGCDTARGEIYSGEGVVGLSWAFLVAGCPQTVVSRWGVDSKATADLMIMFHEHLRSGDAAAEALRKAQMALRKNPRYRQPFYWAPFLVLGR